MFGFIKKAFCTELTILLSVNPLSAIPLSATSLKCVSMTNQECKVRLEIVNINSDEPVFYPFSIKRSKCSGSCNNINNPYAKLCVTDVVKNLNLKVFNLMSITNQARHIEWHKTCKCKYRLKTFFVPYGSSLETNNLLKSMSSILVTFFVFIKVTFLFLFCIQNL